VANKTSTNDILESTWEERFWEEKKKDKLISRRWLDENCCKLYTNDERLCKAYKATVLRY